MKTLKIQAILFPTEEIQNSITSILSKAIQINPEYSSASEILIPDNIGDVPTNFVRLILKLPESNFNIAISREKLTFIWENISLEEGFEISIDEIKAKINEIYPAICNEINIKRIGVVKEFIFERSELEDYFKNIFVGNLQENLAEYRVNLTYIVKTNTSKFNDIINISTNTSIPNNNETLESMILIQNDYNSHQLENLNMKLSPAIDLMTKMYESISIDSIKSKLNWL